MLLEARTNLPDKRTEYVHLCLPDKLYVTLSYINLTTSHNDALWQSRILMKVRESHTKLHTMQINNRINKYMILIAVIKYFLRFFKFSTYF